MAIITKTAIKTVNINFTAKTATAPKTANNKTVIITSNRIESKTITRKY
jgi:hypothetical protein